MAKARIIEDQTAEERLQSQAEELAKLNEDEGGEIFRAIEEMRGAQGTVAVIVKLSPSEEAGICDNIPVAEFTIDELKRRYGVGTYKIRVRGPTGWIPGGGTVKISNAGVKSKTAATNGSSDFISFMEFMEKREADRAAKKSETWGQVAALGIPALATVLAALLGKQSGTDIAGLVSALKPAPGPTLQDLSAMMVNMRDLSAPKQSSDPIESALKIMERVQDLGAPAAGAKGSTGWLDVLRDLIKEAGPAVMPVLQGMQRAAMARQQQANPVRVQQVTPSVAAANSVPLAPGMSSTNDSPVIIAAESLQPVSENDMPKDFYDQYKPMIQPHMDKLVKWASEDREPSAYALMWLDELPDVSQFLSTTQVLEYLNNEQWFEYVSSKEPKLAPYRAWLDEFRIFLIDLLKASLEEEKQED